MSKFTRETNGEYTFNADPRFHIVPETRTTYGGSHGSSPIFGRDSSDGGTYITGWHVRLDGAAVRFGATRKLADAKAWVERMEMRSFAVARATERGYVIAAPNAANAETIARSVSAWSAS